MKDGVDKSIESANRRRLASTTRAQHATTLANTLEAQAKVSQERVMALLSRETLIFGAEGPTSFWASNTIFVPSASSELVEKLSNMPEVEEIHQEHIVTLSPVTESLDVMFNNGTTESGNQWGVEKVAAHDAWSTGNTGEGIIVGAIDTGVRGTHEILKSNYVGAENNGWYDPYDASVEPMDGNGHGSHTMGTIAGSQGYGVAPGAKWLACRGCGTSSCTEKALLGCGQFILCPTDVEGNNKDCSKAPHISSNSWGGGANQQWYMSTVKAWRAAGIIPVFAQGNSGPQCSTANSPGDYPNVIGVGATTSGDKLASFSSVGPSKTKLRKPDVSAPGQSVASAWFNDDSGYKTISGTSMACPHVAGMIALMMSHDSSLTYQDIYNAITMSATTDVLSRPNKNCGGIQDSTFPNNMFGWGVVHTTNAIDSIGLEPPAVTTPEPTGCVLNFWKQCTPASECGSTMWGACQTPCDC